MNVDCLVVGAGFAGSVIAERLASQAGRRVLVVDRRDHIGGNAFDRLDDAGVLVHQYGPHIFHTNSDEVFDYLSQFTEWRAYEHRVLASVDGHLVPIPINLDTVNRLYGLHLTSGELTAFFAERAVSLPRIETSRDVIVSKVGVDLYENFFEGYTRKQWGLDPSELDATVAGRIPVRTDRDDRYFTDRHQAMPRGWWSRPRRWRSWGWRSRRSGPVRCWCGRCRPPSARPIRGRCCATSCGCRDGRATDFPRDRAARRFHAAGG